MDVVSARPASKYVQYRYRPALCRPLPDARLLSSALQPYCTVYHGHMDMDRLDRRAPNHLHASPTQEHTHLHELLQTATKAPGPALAPTHTYIYVHCTEYVPGAPAHTCRAFEHPMYCYV